MFQRNNYAYKGEDHLGELCSTTKTLLLLQLNYEINYQDYNK